MTTSNAPISSLEPAEQGARMVEMLRTSGLRPTRQRLALATLLFSKGNRHFTAEQLHGEALSAGVPVSLATIYNALHDFETTGLIRECAVDKQSIVYDTNTSKHDHFMIVPEGRLVDIDSSRLSVDGIPQPPEGFEVCGVDVIVRIRRIGSK